MFRSCYTCRRRHVECQMTHPPCKKCQKAGLECLQKRPLRWVDGPAFRNRARTSQAHQRDKSNTLNKGDYGESCLYESRLAESTLEATNAVERKGQSAISHKGDHISIHISIPPSLKDPSFDALDDASMYYLNYCQCAQANAMRVTLTDEIRQQMCVQVVCHVRQPAKPFETTYSGSVG